MMLFSLVYSSQGEVHRIFLFVRKKEKFHEHFLQCDLCGHLKFLYVDEKIAKKQM